MAEFVAFNADVEVNGQTIYAFVNCMERGKDKRLAILEKHGIALNPNDWYNQQKWLNAFKEVAESVGEMNLFLIGSAIIENAQFPPIKNMEEGLGVIDVAYHMNHRLNETVMFNPENGQMLEGIGHYSLLSYNAAEKTAVMVCNNPYPSKFDEGIISAVCNKFKPADVQKISVKVDISKERRTKGGESCTYIISW